MTTSVAALAADVESTSAELIWAGTRLDAALAALDDPEVSRRWLAVRDAVGAVVDAYGAVLDEAAGRLEQRMRAVEHATVGVAGR